jgi:hypothetical protein
LADSLVREGITNLFYIKKLAAGSPTELTGITLPIGFEIQPDKKSAKTFAEFYNIFLTLMVGKLDRGESTFKGK